MFFKGGKCFVVVIFRAEPLFVFALIGVMKMKFLWGVKSDESVGAVLSKFTTVIVVIVRRISIEAIKHFWYILKL